MAGVSFLEKDFPNIWDYLYSYGNTSFKQLPFNVADNLVLACLTYIPWEKFEEPNESFKPLTLKHAVEDFLGWLRPDFLLHHYPDWCKKQLVVAAALLKSSRFASLKWTSFGFELSHEDNTQFGARAIDLGGDAKAVCFRGTDNSILGWKESLNLAIYPSVPGQVSAAKFLKEQRKNYPEKKFYVLGHSKGGNLAVYASSRLTEEEAERVITVYSDDGPGLAKEIFDLDGHHRIQPKIIHIVPEYDVIGSLLLHEQITRIVKASPNNDFLNQHDLNNWHLNKDCLYQLDLAEKLEPNSELVSDSVNELLDTKLSDKKERERLVNALFNTVTERGVTEAGKVLENPNRFIRKFLLQFTKQDKLEKRKRRGFAFDLIRVIRKNWFARLGKAKKNEKERAPALLEDKKKI